ncbi:MAG: hypothetical protein SPL39_03735 [Selenomonadaceae bacterium]|nr:hypothetical protein [Selenomonadaceae bacterium]
MILYLLAAILIVLLILLYRYLPNKRIYACFCLTLAVLGVVCYAFWPRTQSTEAMTPEQVYDLQQQQQIFSTWYAGYQKDIKDLDHNWRWYHQILEDFKEDNISIQTAYVRLKQLEEDEKLLTARIAESAPPLELHDNFYDLTAAILQKTKAYADAQQKAITLTRAASDPQRLTTDDQEEQARQLQTVMEKESPVGLFTAEEIAQIQEGLAIPDTEN